MSLEMDFKIQREKGREEGRMEERDNIIKLFLKSGMKVNEIYERTHFPLHLIQAVENRLN